MPIKPYVNVSGTWRATSNIWVNVNGTWRIVSNAYQNVSGVWRQFYQRIFTVTYAASQQNCVLFTDAVNRGWDQSAPLLVVINGGVVLSASSTGNYAFNTSGVPSPILMTNNGAITGAGGAGGVGGTAGIGSAGQSGSGGAGGGPAMFISVAIAITNNGQIWGGAGGGGGGGGGNGVVGNNDQGGGGGGGGGAGVNGGAGNIGGLTSNQAFYGGRRGATGGNGGLGFGGAGGAGDDLFPGNAQGGYSPGAGGAGGSPGAAGGAGGGAAGGGGGGPPGVWATGSGNVSFAVTGDVRGPAG